MAKILLVDDDPDILEATTLILESAGYEVTAAQNGIEAMACLKAEKPDLMVLDMLMPKMDGFAVCKELQDPRWSKYQNVPILILSSVREEASRRRYELETGLQLGVDDYVEKPISPDILLQRVSQLVRRHLKA